MRGVLTVIAIALLVLSAAALVARYVPISNVVLLALAALAPYLMLGAPLSAVILGFSRQWVLATVAIVLTAATIAVQMPWHVRSKAPPGVPVRLVSANLRYGRADPAALVQIARATNTDILGVQELTPELAEALSANGLEELLPHRALRAREGPAGVGIWSRHSIDEHLSMSVSGWDYSPRAFTSPVCRHRQRLSPHTRRHRGRSRSTAGAPTWTVCERSCGTSPPTGPSWWPPISTRRGTPSSSGGCCVTVIVTVLSRRAPA